MIKVFLLLFVVVFVKGFDWGLVGKIIECIVNEHSGDTAFKSWHQIHKKTYKEKSDEWIKRNAIFIEKHEKIKAHNSKNLPFKLKLNAHSDLLEHEHEKKLGISRSPYNKSSILKKDDVFNANPIDYRDKLSPVRDQGQCGSCWTFSTTGAAEGNIGIKFGVNYKYLSTQQLVDCDKNDNGCNGGDFLTAFNYINATGLVDDASYTYTAQQGQCNLNSSSVGDILRGLAYCSDYEDGNVCTNQIVYDLLANGPLSVPVDGGTFEFQNYGSGILTVNCTQPNHAVVLVGYGTDDVYGDYWIIRNSWGSTWGENGYARIAVSQANNDSCFITSEAYLPLV